MEEKLKAIADQLMQLANECGKYISIASSPNLGTDFITIFDGKDYYDYQDKYTILHHPQDTEKAGAA